MVCCQILRLLNVPVFRKRDWSELWLEWIAQRVRNKQCHRQSETVGFTHPEKELSRVNTWTRFTGSPDSLECSRASVMFTLVLSLALQSLMNSMLEVGDWTHSFVKKATEACWSRNILLFDHSLVNPSAQLRAWNALRVKHRKPNSWQCQDPIVASEQAFLHELRIDLLTNQLCNEFSCLGKGMFSKRFKCVSHLKL